MFSTTQCAEGNLHDLYLTSPVSMCSSAMLLEFAKEMLYRSQPTDMRVRIALANSGDLQIELIQPLDDEPSPYRDFLQDNGGHGGLQHVSSWPSTDTFDNLIANHQVTFSGRGGGTRFAYFSDALDFGMMMEIADLTRGTRAYFDEIKAAAAHWNGVSARA